MFETFECLYAVISMQTKKGWGSIEAKYFLSLSPHHFTVINKLHQQSLHILYVQLKSPGMFIVSASIDFVIMLEVVASVT